MKLVSRNTEAYECFRFRRASKFDATYQKHGKVRCACFRVRIQENDFELVAGRSGHGLEGLIYKASFGTADPESIGGVISPDDRPPRNIWSFRFVLNRKAQ